MRVIQRGEQRRQRKVPASGQSGLHQLRQEISEEAACDSAPSQRW